MMSSQSTLHSSGSNDEENTFHSSSNNDEENESKGLQVEGTIYGKIDSGYLVCVKVGSELCNGVIYHPKEQASSCNAIVLDNLQPHHYLGWRMRRMEKDLNLPKPRWNDYNFFYAEKKAILKSLYPTRKRWEFTKMIAKSWKDLPPEEKMVYKNYAKKDKERHQKEWKEYNEIRTTASSCN